MRKIAVLAGTALLGLSPQALGYTASGTVTFAWGGNNNAVAAAESLYGATIDSSADIGWLSGGTSQLANMADSTYFTAQSGYNARSWYNGDYTSTAQCAAGAGVVPTSGGSGTARKYGCRWNDYGGTLLFVEGPVADTAAALTGASATGTITATDTTLTGTLTVINTSDEPTGATTTFSGGNRTSNSVGNGFAGYNYRSADGSPFGNYWLGITTAGTLTVNLTGSFSATSWQITGGTVRFSDAGFACQQGGLGGSGLGTRCLSSSVAGGQSPTEGANLSWGWDIDGGGPGTTNAEVEVRNEVGGSIIETLSGVLASISVSNGVFTTQSGEFRRGLGSSICPTYIVWDGTRISCGSLTTGLLSISGTVSEVPVPAAAWLVAPAVLAAGRYVRRRKKA